MWLPVIGLEGISVLLFGLVDNSLFDKNLHTISLSVGVEVPSVYVHLESFIENFSVHSTKTGDSRQFPSFWQDYFFCCHHPHDTFADEPPFVCFLYTPTTLAGEWIKAPVFFVWIEIWPLRLHKILSHFYWMIARSDSLFWCLQKKYSGESIYEKDSRYVLPLPILIVPRLSVYILPPRNWSVCCRFLRICCDWSERREPPTQTI